MVAFVAVFVTVVVTTVVSGIIVVSSMLVVVTLAGVDDITLTGTVLFPVVDVGDTVEEMLVIGCPVEIVVCIEGFVVPNDEIVVVTLVAVGVDSSYVWVVVSAIAILTKYFIVTKNRLNHNSNVQFMIYITVMLRTKARSIAAPPRITCYCSLGAFYLCLIILSKIADI